MRTDGSALCSLSEIGDCPLFVEQKLLRAPSSREVSEVGNITPVIWMCGVSSRETYNLPREVSGRFREDLYLWLNVIGVEVPSHGSATRRSSRGHSPHAAGNVFALADPKRIEGFTHRALDAV